jgi:hypothetical protein
MAVAGHLRLPPWQRRCLLIGGGTLALTGAAWLAVHWLLGAGAGELPHPAEAWLMRVHGAAMFLALFTSGLLAGGHVGQGWRWSGRHRLHGQRRTGLFLCAGLALLVLSGYALYYLVPEALRDALGLGHAALGIAMLLALVWHARSAARRRARARWQAL